MTSAAPELARELTDEELVDGATEGAVKIRGPLRKLVWWAVPANFAIFVIWGAVPGLLLAKQVEMFDPDPQAKVANLAIIATVGAFVAMIAQPVAGTISDRTRSRFGRRAPWMIIGSVVGGIALITLGFQHSMIGFILCWAVVQGAYNFAQGPLSAIMPDRVPRMARGTFAAVSGIALMVGALGGSVVGASFVSMIPVGYTVLAIFAVVALLLFNVFNRDRSSLDQVNPPFVLKTFLSTFWVNPIKHPDFFWAFTGRLLLYTGYFAVINFQLFILSDYIGLGDAATSMVPILSLAGLPGIIISIAVSGPISDRFGRRKPFVFASSILVAVAMLFPLFMPTFTGMLIMSIIAGFGFGMFQSIDTALMSEVLPSKESFAKDLGIVNIAATLPQTLAPGVAGLIVYNLGYAALFPVGIALSILGALAVWPIKAVR
ncbi:MAG: MFS transporter [Microbacterium sp.]